MIGSSRWYRSVVVRSLVSGVALGAAFPPSPVPTLAFVAFLPWLTVFDVEASFGRIVRSTYVMLAAFHAVTLYWAGGFTHANDGWMMVAGAALILLHPFFVLPFVVGAWAVRKVLGRFWGLLAFVLLWMSFEFFHTRGELSFPWAAIGNSQAADLARIQIVELFSVSGLSFHVLVFNVVAYLVLLEVAEARWPGNRGRTYVMVTVMTLLYFGPLAYGWIELGSTEADEHERTHVRVTVIQPNIDPWEKWGKPGVVRWPIYERQLAVLDSLTRSRSGDHPDLVVWPETATPFHLLLPAYEPYLTRVKKLSADVGGVILTGLPHARYFDKATAPVTSRPLNGSDQFVESYNSATTIAPDGTVGPVYGKVVLVPFAERLPHAEALRFLIEPLRWNVGISSWGQGTDTTVFTLRSRDGQKVRFSAMVCYESVFPEYVRAFVQRGAQFLVVITNDSWWGNTSGSYQHAAYASLRAVETRRWVVQGANGGISLVVNPQGRVIRGSSLFSQTAWTERIETSNATTLFVRAGDVVGHTSVAAGGLLGLWTLISLFRQRKKL